MNALLWTLAIFGAVNTLAMAYCLFFIGGLPKQTNKARFIDAIYTAVLGVWAVALLAGQK